MHLANDLEWISMNFRRWESFYLEMCRSQVQLYFHLVSFLVERTVFWSTGEFLSLFIYVYFLMFRKHSVRKEKIWFAFILPSGNNISIRVQCFTLAPGHYIVTGFKEKSNREAQVSTIYILWVCINLRASYCLFRLMSILVGHYDLAVRTFSTTVYTSGTKMSSVDHIRT